MQKPLTLKQASEFLHLHPETVRQRAKAGQIPASFVTGRWLFLPTDLLDYIRSGYGDQTCKASISGVKSTTYHSPYRVEKEYAAALAPRT